MGTAVSKPLRSKVWDGENVEVMGSPVFLTTVWWTEVTIELLIATKKFSTPKETQVVRRFFVSHLLNNLNVKIYFHVTCGSSGPQNVYGETTRKVTRVGVLHACRRTRPWTSKCLIKKVHMFKLTNQSLWILSDSCIEAHFRAHRRI